MENSPSVDPGTASQSARTTRGPQRPRERSALRPGDRARPGRAWRRSTSCAGAPATAVGPVLHDDSCDTLGFLVPPGTADAWDVPGSACTQTNGRGPALGGADSPPPVAGTDWLLPPGDADLATDPAVLRAALGEAARSIEAADNCR